jgi:hypothetical protein
MTRSERRLLAELECNAAMWILREFICARGSYEGPATWILQHLDERATPAQKNEKAFPKTPQQLGRMLSKFAGTLKHKGIEVSFSRHGFYGRAWRLSVVTGKENRARTRGFETVISPNFPNFEATEPENHEVL